MGQVSAQFRTDIAIRYLANHMAVAGIGEGLAQLNEEAVEFTEKRGEYVPGDITLIDENGQPVNLGEFVDKPTILMMVYYSCPGICTPLLTEVADILGKSRLDPTKTPFQLLAVSFEPVSPSFQVLDY